MARVNLDRAALTRTFSEASRRELRVAERQVVNRAKILCPVDTGRLRASIKSKRSGFFTLRPKATVYSNVAYAGFVNDGTRPHIIRPRRAKALRFRMNGRIVYAQVVNHPGTRARPFLDRALEEIARPRGYRIHEE